MINFVLISFLSDISITAHYIYNEIRQLLHFHSKFIYFISKKGYGYKWTTLLVGFVFLDL